MQTVARHEQHCGAAVDYHGNKAVGIERIDVLLAWVGVELLTDERTLYTVEINHVTLVAINSGAQYGTLVLRKGCNAGQT